MKIYTRSGDDGTTSLLGSTRVPKHSPKVEAYGTVDELASVLGVVRAHWKDSVLDAGIHQIQEDLFEINARLASSGDRFPGADPTRVDALETSIDEMEKELEPLRTFIFPGGSIPAAHLHVARTICRRAERMTSRLDQDDRGAHTLRYLNRLADWLFVAARYANHTLKVDDIPWVRD